MRRARWLRWLIFAASALVVLEVLAWVSVQTLRLEAREREARREAEQNQRLRLALWRMESAVLGLLAAEAARPPAHYRAFPHADEPGGASPLLLETPELVRMHFELLRGGEVRSPQAPGGEDLRRALELGLVDREGIAAGHARLLEVEQMIAREGLNGPDERTGAMEAAPAEALSTEVEDEAFDAADDDLEFLARRQAVREAIGTEATDEMRAEVEAGEALHRLRAPVAAAPDPAVAPSEDAARLGRVLETVGPLRPLWRRDPASGRAELLFVRAVNGVGGPRVQGFWVDWPALRDELLARVVDILPNAQLQPIPEPLVVPSRDGRPMLVSQRLASIPARLVPSAVAPASGPDLGAVRLMLLIAWLAVLGAIAAIGMVLHRSMALGERRGRFVSAVTHELRTPLTSFQLYTRLLEQTDDEQKRRRYAQTLSEQAERLGRIVENVLAYARLERGRSRPALGAAPAGETLGAVLEAAAARGEAAGMDVRWKIDEPVERAHVPDAPDAIERVVFNLIDNAARYAGGQDWRVEVSATLHRDRVAVVVRDFGPGVSAGEARRIFRPFEQAHASEQPEAGLGLGLALSRQVARDLGGDLRLVEVEGPGAAFELTLPARGR